MSVWWVNESCHLYQCVTNEYVMSVRWMNDETIASVFIIATSATHCPLFHFPLHPHILFPSLSLIPPPSLLLLAFPALGGHITGGRCYEMAKVSLASQGKRILGIRHVTCTNESWHTCEDVIALACDCVMAHEYVMSVRWMNESCRLYQCVTNEYVMSVWWMNESCHLYQCVTNEYVIHIWISWHTRFIYDIWITSVNVSRTSMSFIYESHDIHEWVMAHVDKSHTCAWVMANELQDIWGGYGQ